MPSLLPLAGPGDKGGEVHIHYGCTASTRTEYLDANAFGIRFSALPRVPGQLAMYRRSVPTSYPSRYVPPKMHVQLTKGAARGVEGTTRRTQGTRSYCTGIEQNEPKAI